MDENLELQVLNDEYDRLYSIIEGSNIPDADVNKVLGILFSWYNSKVLDITSPTCH